jgi:outer membrane protein
MTSKPLVTLAAAALLALAPALARAESKVAVIDMTRAINETNEGSRATLNLKTLFEKRQIDLDAKQQGLLKDKADLDRKCKNLPRPDCERGQEELQKKLFDLQQLMGQYQQEIQKKQGEATQPIFQKMLRIVERLARAKGFDIVVDRNAAPYSKTDLDVTEAAIAAYNTDTPTIQPLTAAEKATLAAPPPGGGPGGPKKADPPPAPKKK